MINKDKELFIKSQKTFFLQLKEQVGLYYYYQLIKIKWKACINIIRENIKLK